MKQRSAWRFRRLQDQNMLIAFRPGEASALTVQLKLTPPHVSDAMALHNVLNRVDTDTLNGILSATSPEESNWFCYSMSGFMLHTSCPKVRAHLVNVLTRDRLGEITIPNRAILIGSLEQCLLSKFILERYKADLRKAVVNILLGTCGNELSILKDSICYSHQLLASSKFMGTVKVHNESCQPDVQSNGSTNRLRTWMNALRSNRSRPQIPNTYAERTYTDLVSLIYDSLRPVETAQVLQHIAIEACRVKDKQSHLVKVISDLDDTFMSGWLDRRYPSHILYPGVLELYRRISHSVLGHQDGAPPSPTFITARPKGWFNMGRYVTNKSLQGLGLSHSAVLHGRVKGLLTNQRIALMKYENFTRFATVFPEFKFVFYGDSGQGDAYLARILLDTYSHIVLGAFIHDIEPAKAHTGDGHRKQSYLECGIPFYRNYAVAARQALDKQLISQEDMEAVHASCLQDFEAIHFPSSCMKVSRRDELLQDLS